MVQAPYTELATLLRTLVAELQGAALWSSVSPSSQAMASTAPFACDAMPFEHWLQFIFVPRMQALIDATQPLPRNFALTPMGEETLHPLHAKGVMDALSAIDALMSDPS